MRMLSFQMTVWYVSTSCLVMLTNGGKCWTYIRFDFIQNIWNNNNSQPYGVVNIKLRPFSTSLVPYRNVLVSMHRLRLVNSRTSEYFLAYYGSINQSTLIGTIRLKWKTACSHKICAMSQFQCNWIFRNYIGCIQL